MKATAIFFHQVPLWATMSFVLLLLVARDLEAAPNAELWPRWQKHDPASKQKVDHGPWEAFLKQYVVSSHPSGINRVRYPLVSEEDRKLLKNYLQSLQGLPISSYNRAEQRAYWLNLYNGLTVALNLYRYPEPSV